MGAAEDINWAEKRNALRQRTFKSGRIVVNGLSTMDCVIRNMSLTGARLALPNAMVLPDTFELFIGDEGLRRECEIKSRTETSAGIRFFRPLTTRELGSEFMSAKGIIDHSASHAGEDAAGTGEPVGNRGGPRKGIVKIVPRALPNALTRNLPW